ncbi:hypothetical protein BG015_002227 [Linnemannia schmuckeri]|uniref:Uncharacterized protein n=1 Tax=Linnemannia schmuckeri TaxID=64567 RepID=A0A9P5VDL9_9FUNG|nr:hypothetical protein BG015_002227 [Linnemannia schmuckeri]
MPCRAAPPPSPPPHSTQDLTPSPAALSNPLVYRLRTCCLQEFLPRVSLVQKSTPSLITPRPRSSPTQLSILFDSQDHNSNFDPHLSSHPHSSPSTSTHSPNSYSNSPLSHPHPQHPHANPLQHHDNNHQRQEHVHQEQHEEPYASPQQQQYPPNEEDRDPTNSLSAWQPPASSIQLTQLHSALAHRFLDWALSENILSLPSSKESGTAETNNTSTTATARATTTRAVSSDDTEGEQEEREQRERSIASAGQDWAAAHDLVWPEGDYYMAKKTFIREGVAHLKRGGRYIFVEPVLGPATSYLYPKWVDSEEDEEVESAATYEQQQQQEGYGAEDLLHDATATVDISSATSTDQSSSSSDSGNDASVQHSVASSLPTPAVPATASENEQDKDKDDDNVSNDQQHQQQEESAILDKEEGGRRENEKDEGEEDEEDKESHKEENEGAPRECQHHDETSNDVSSFSATNLEEDRAQEGLVTPLSPLSTSTTTTPLLGGMNGERIEKEETDDSSAATSPPSSTASATSTTATNSSTTSSSTSSSPSSSSSTRSSFEEAPSSPLQQHQSTEFLEPYSPLLDPSTDGQDQFEYGLYELRFIPKIQYLLPSQLLPSRQSFIVHLDEDRPTLASPVPAHSKRSECRCQLMMRKVLMHRDLLQVWPPIPPVRTLQERQQEAEEEARMMEIKQKVQLQTSNWRKTLQTQMVACR